MIFPFVICADDFPFTTAGGAYCSLNHAFDPCLIQFDLHRLEGSSTTAHPQYCKSYHGNVKTPALQPLTLPLQVLIGLGTAQCTKL